MKLSILIATGMLLITSAHSAVTSVTIDERINLRADGAYLRFGTNDGSGNLISATVDNTPFSSSIWSNSELGRNTGEKVSEYNPNNYANGKINVDFAEDGFRLRGAGANQWVYSADIYLYGIKFDGIGSNDTLEIASIDLVANAMLRDPSIRQTQPQIIYQPIITFGYHEQDGHWIRVKYLQQDTGDAYDRMYTDASDSGPFDLFRINLRNIDSVPEPTSAALLAIGGLGVLLRRSRKA